MRTRKRNPLALAGAFLIVSAFLIYWFGPGVLNTIGASLIRADDLEPCDAIVVLTGDHKGERMATAIDLFKRGYGKKIIFWGGSIYWKITWADMFLRQFEEAGISSMAAAWSEEELPEMSTRAEAMANFRIMQENSIRSFILVTSPFHTARAAYVYEPMARENGMTMLVSPSADSRVKLENWWRDGHNAKKIMDELVKTVFYRFFITAFDS